MFFCASACDSTARLLTESRASSCGAEDSEEGHMDPAVFLVALVTVVGTAAVTIVKVARLWTGRPESPSADVTARLEALERGVRDLQQEQADTKERLGFAGGFLRKAGGERRVGRLEHTAHAEEQVD